MNPPILSVKLRKQFPNSGADSFQLDFAADFSPGFTALFGPSGAGKSTLLDCIAGLLPADSALITLGDETLTDTASNLFIPPQRRRIAYVFQSLALFPHLTVGENISYGLFGLPISQMQPQVESILDSFQISPLRHRKPRELSGGEKQRVALARSLVTQPRLLLLDEPLTGLDSALRRSILEDLRAWNTAHPIPVIYVTHNREELDAIGERVITMAAGKLAESGSPSDVLDAPRSVALAQSAGFENLLPARVWEHHPADGVTVVQIPGAHCQLEIPLAGAAPGELIQIAIRAGDILLAGEEPRSLSARNILPGVIQSLETRGSIISAQVQAGTDFTVHVTPGAVRSLYLAPGKKVWLVVKTHSCHLVR